MFIIVTLMGLPYHNIYADMAPKTQYTVDASSAKMYLAMARKAVKGNMPTETEWDSLFVSPSYKALLDNIHWDKQKFKNNVRDAFEIVYDPSKASICDSIALKLSDISSIEDELPFFVSTALSIKNKLDHYTTIINTLDIDNVIRNADAMARTLLPDNGAGIEPQISPIYFIVWDLECRALNSGLFLDVNTFFCNGLKAATEALGHEMHHFYLPPAFELKYDKDIMDGASYALICNMKEGVADILNKKQMPLSSLYPYGDDMLAIYNADYEATPATLEELDNITCSYLDGKMNFERYFQQASQCAHFEGHTTGDYMVFLIRDQLGLDAVIESVGDLDLFVDNYNKAADKAGTYKFSNRFTQHIHNVSTASKKTD